MSMPIIFTVLYLFLDYGKPSYRKVPYSSCVYKFSLLYSYTSDLIIFGDISIEAFKSSWRSFLSFACVLNTYYCYISSALNSFFSVCKDLIKNNKLKKFIKLPDVLKNEPILTTSSSLLLF